MDNNNQLRDRIQNFIDSFELVFDYDWVFTKDAINDEYQISEKGSFLDPFPGKHYCGGKGYTWGSRSSLFSAYTRCSIWGIRNK